MNQDGWELFDLTQPATVHPEAEAERRRNAAQDAERRALLPQREAQLLAAEAALVEKEAAVAAARAALEVATAVNADKYKAVTRGRAVRDPRSGLPSVFLDDPRCEPELGRRKLAEQALSAAQAERTPAVEWRDWLISEIAFIKGTVPATA